MLGLLNLGGWDDPRRQALLAAAAQMMSARGNTGQAIGQGLMGGLSAYNQAGLLADRRKEEGQQREIRQMQLDRFKKEQADEAGMRNAFQTAFGQPNVNPQNFQGGPMLADDGTSIPQVPGGGGLPEFLKLAGGYMNPVQAVGLMQKQTPKYHVVNGALVPEPMQGQTSSSPVYQAPREQWRDLGRDDKTGQHMQVNTLTGERKAVGTMPNSVTVTNIGEREEQKKLGELRVKNYGDIQGAAAAARKEMALLSGLEKIRLETGKFTPANATVAAWLTAAGAKNEDLRRIASGAQTFEAFTNDLVMQQQLAQKGPQTESDARRLEATQARVSNTPEANRLNIAFRKALAKRTIEQERFYSDWMQKNKTLEGAEAAWFKGKGGASIWDEPELKKYQTQDGGNVIDFSQLPRG